MSISFNTKDSSIKIREEVGWLENNKNCRGSGEL